MDEADRAGMEIEREQERLMANALARAVRSLERREDCMDCGEPLSGIRCDYGTCVYCAQAREEKGRLRGSRP